MAPLAAVPLSDLASLTSGGIEPSRLLISSVTADLSTTVPSAGIAWAANRAAGLMKLVRFFRKLLAPKEVRKLAKSDPKRSREMGKDSMVDLPDLRHSRQSYWQHWKLQRNETISGVVSQDHFPTFNTFSTSTYCSGPCKLSVAFWIRISLRRFPTSVGGPRGTRNSWAGAWLASGRLLNKFNPTYLSKQRPLPQEGTS